MRKGDALGFMLGGSLELALLIAGGIGAGVVWAPLVGLISFAESPVKFTLVALAWAVVGVSSLTYGWQKYRKARRYERAHRDEKTPTPAEAPGKSVLRIVLVLLGTIVALAVSAPLLGMAGRTTCAAVFVPGFVLHVTGWFRKGNVLMFVGFIIAVAAALGLWFAGGP
jgi:hypothetical protein